MALLALLVCLAALPGCQGGTGSTAQHPILALVAASTRDAVEELAAAFAKNGGSKVTMSAEDSGRLATQIVNGAPAHLFLSANEKWADHVKDKGFAQEVHPLLGNTLVVVVPRGNPAGVHVPADLVEPAVKRLALAGPTVPAGIYARQALKTLALWDQVQGRTISGENVRVTLTYVERGEAEAGVVYATDAKVTDMVEQVHELGAQTHDPIRYPLVLLKAGQENPEARRFRDFLRSPQAARVFKKYGFTWLGED